MIVQCSDNAGDRKVGEEWERQFGILAGSHGKVFTPHQIGHPRGSALAYGPGGHKGWDRYLLPDVTVWTAPGEHHEIKHKSPTRDGCYGLERYRLDALVKWANITGQNVYYTIHDWQKAGARSSRDPVPNRIEDWCTADVKDLARRITKSQRGSSWVDGIKKNDVLICYWAARPHFRPLVELWRSASQLSA